MWGSKHPSGLGLLQVVFRDQGQIMSHVYHINIIGHGNRMNNIMIYV